MEMFNAKMVEQVMRMLAPNPLLVSSMPALNCPCAIIFLLLNVFHEKKLHQASILRALTFLISLHSQHNNNNNIFQMVSILNSLI